MCFLAIFISSLRRAVIKLRRKVKRCGACPSSDTVFVPVSQAGRLAYLSHPDTRQVFFYKELHIVLVTWKSDEASFHLISTYLKFLCTFQS
jgi:hypothetical protein